MPPDATRGQPTARSAASVLLAHLLAGFLGGSVATLLGAAAYVYFLGATLGRQELLIAIRLLREALPPATACGGLLGLLAPGLRNRLERVRGGALFSILAAGGGALAALTFFGPASEAARVPASLSCGAAWTAVAVVTWGAAGRRTMKR